MLIGLNGKKQSGKDTVAQFMLDWAKTNDFNARRVAFADQLKVSAARALGFPEDDALVFCNELKSSGVVSVKCLEYSFEISGREFLQRYGTEAHRELFGDDFWIHQVISEDLDHSNELLIVTDVRFPNEADAIHCAGGDVIKMVREGSEEDSHPSEQDLDDSYIDIEILNDSDLDSLRWAATQCVERLYAEWL